MIDWSKYRDLMPDGVPEREKSHARNPFQKQVRATARRLTERPFGSRLFISPDLLTDEELEQRVQVRPQIVWREGEHWRVCEWATGHRAFALLGAGWEVFDDWEDDDDGPNRRIPPPYA